MEYLSADNCAAFIERHRDIISGVKVRMGSETIRHEGLEPLRLASLAARKAGVPFLKDLKIKTAASVSNV